MLARLPRVGPVFVGLAWSVLVACQHELSGPQPEISDLSPGLICNAQLENNLTLTGSALSPLPVGSLGSAPGLVLPTVTLIPTLTLAGVPVDDHTPSIELPERDLHWLSQKSMFLEIGPGLALPEGAYALQVENRGGRFAQLDPGLVAIGAPTVMAVEPDLVCLAPGATNLTLRGETLLRIGSALPQVRIGDDLYLPGAPAGCAPLPGSIPDAARCVTLTVEVPPGALPAGSYPIRVTNPTPAGCTSENAPLLVVIEPPELLAVDPPVVFDHLALHATLVTAGLVGSVSAVYLTPAGEAVPVVELPGIQPDPLHPERIQVDLIGDGALAEGLYDLSLQSDIGCVAQLAGGLRVTATTTLAPLSIDPTHGWTKKTTPVTLTTPDPAPGGLAPFRATPWVYLRPSPSNPAPDRFAIALLEVVFLGQHRLSALVPEGIPPGLFDLVVVNPPDLETAIAEVGVLPDAYTVTEKNE